MRDQTRWDDKILAWAMSNPGLLVQLFRFIDCLPALRSKTEVARHLQEYLSDESVELPSDRTFKSRQDPSIEMLN